MGPAAVPGLQSGTAVSGSGIYHSRAGGAFLSVYAWSFRLALYTMLVKAPSLDVPAGTPVAETCRRVSLSCTHFTETCFESSLSEEIWFDPLKERWSTGTVS
jgi:hypothetical protein